MKKFLAVLLAMLMLVSLAACGGADKDDTVKPAVDPNTVGGVLYADFEKNISENPSITAQEMADALLANEIIQFMGGAIPVEEGWLTGFGEAEIKGFKEGVMFAPMISSIPFVGYIFVLEDGADVEAFKTTLKDNADPRWNICVEADQTVVESNGNMVFFLMCPKSIEG